MKVRNCFSMMGLIAGTLCAVLFAAAYSTAAENAQFRDEFHQVYALNPDGHIKFSNLIGDVQVTVWDRNEVKVDAVKTAVSQQRLDEAQIKIEATPSAITIKSEYPHDRNRSDREQHYNNAAKVNYVLTVPRGAIVDGISVVNGNLTVDGLSAAIKASTVNGTLKASGLGGPVKLSCVNCKLLANFEKLASDVHLSTVNGELDVTMPSDSQSMISASTVSGSIRNDFNVAVKKGMVGQSLKAQLGDGGQSVKLSTVSGSIAIHRANDGRPLSSVKNLQTHTDNNML